MFFSKIKLKNKKSSKTAAPNKKVTEGEIDKI